MKRNKILQIVLTDKQRKTYESIVRKGMSSAAEIRRANVLLLADESGERKKQTDAMIARSLHISRQSVHNIKVRYLEETDNQSTSTSQAIKRKKRSTPPVPAKCTGDVEAKIIAIACSNPPDGRCRWTLRLISERAVELKIVDTIFHTQLGRIPKNKHKNNLRCGALPQSRTQLSSHVCRMCLRCTKSPTTP